MEKWELNEITFQWNSFAIFISTKNQKAGTMSWWGGEKISKMEFEQNKSGGNVCADDRF